MWWEEAAEEEEETGALGVVKVAARSPQWIAASIFRARHSDGNVGAHAHHLLPLLARSCARE